MLKNTIIIDVVLKYTNDGALRPQVRRNTIELLAIASTLLSKQCALPEHSATNAPSLISHLDPPRLSATPFELHHIRTIIYIPPPCHHQLPPAIPPVSKRLPYEIKPPVPQRVSPPPNQHLTTSPHNRAPPSTTPAQANAPKTPTYCTSCSPTSASQLTSIY